MPEYKVMPESLATEITRLERDSRERVLTVNWAGDVYIVVTVAQVEPVETR